MEERARERKGRWDERKKQRERGEKGKVGRWDGREGPGEKGKMG